MRAGRESREQTWCFLTGGEASFDRDGAAGSASFRADIGCFLPSEKRIILI